MTLGTRKNAVVVPTNAIQTGQQGQLIYVVKADNSVEMRPVTVAVAAGADSVIEKGLSAGETVVVGGQLRLTPGAVVESKEKQVGEGKKK